MSPKWLQWDRIWGLFGTNFLLHYLKHDTLHNPLTTNDKIFSDLSEIFVSDSS